MTHPRSIAAAAALLAVAAVPTAAQAKPKAKPDVTVMTRNLYLGADIIKLAAATDLADEQKQTASLFADVQATNFPLRAKALVKEIKQTAPDLVALQEVARYRRGPQGVHDGVTNATTNLYDWLAILQKEIKAQHLHYRVAARQTELDVETASADGYDLRLTLGNAVLVKTGKRARVKVTRALSGTFSAASQLVVPLKDQTVKASRGYAGVDAKVAGVKFRFLDPHAEAYSDEDATKQFKELLAGAAKSRKLPTIIAGDFNSDPTAGGSAGEAYKAVVHAGFVDTGKRTKTCCQDPLLDNAASKLDKWIDHIVVRPRAKVLHTRLVGNRTNDRIGGLWPSDHAGVVATVRLK